VLLNDSEIVTQIANGLLPAGMAQTGDWYLKNSQVQAASLDLTVGLVFAPCEESNDDANLPVGSAEYILEPGRTAIVLTREELKMPNNLLAIGFPPSKELSAKGILMTNPGQVDPGYQGKLRFTVINMGRKDFVLRQGDIIVSLILMQLAKPAQADWLARHSGQKGGPITWENLNTVSADFVEVDDRARKVAKEEVAKADVKIKNLQTWVPIGVAALTLIGTLAVAWFQASWKDSLTRMQQQIAVLQSQSNFNQLSSQVQNLQTQVSTLQQQLSASNRNAPNTAKH
jgi:dCTP deaminase